MKTGNAQLLKLQLFTFFFQTELCAFDTNNKESPCSIEMCVEEPESEDCIIQALDYCYEWDDRGCAEELPNLLNKVNGEVLRAKMTTWISAPPNKLISINYWPEDLHIGGNLCNWNLCHVTSYVPELKYHYCMVAPGYFSNCLPHSISAKAILLTFLSLIRSSHVHPSTWASKWIMTNPNCHCNSGFHRNPTQSCWLHKHSHNRSVWKPTTTITNRWVT